MKRCTRAQRGVVASVFSPCLTQARPLSLFAPQVEGTLERVAATDAEWTRCAAKLNSEETVAKSDLAFRLGEEEGVARGAQLRAHEIAARAIEAELVSASSSAARIQLRARTAGIVSEACNSYAHRLGLTFVARAQRERRKRQGIVSKPPPSPQPESGTSPHGAIGAPTGSWSPVGSTPTNQASALTQAGGDDKHGWRRIESTWRRAPRNPTTPARSALTDESTRAPLSSPLAEERGVTNTRTGTWRRVG